MRRYWSRVVPLLALAALTVACYGRALFAGEQFAYRDAAHFYYPLYERVQAEWRAGRLPLWEPEENAGMPLLGNPTAAVLYPGKLLFAVAPTYAWGARLYVVAHTLLAFATLVVLLRSWGVGGTAAAFGGLAYAFGGPVLFQYCNIIYLVGAAWLPLGFHAADRWLRLGRRAAVLELAVVLALEVLGGDPEVAYLTGLCALVYALGLARSRARGASERADAERGRAWVWGLKGLALAVAWVLATLVMARVAFLVRPVKSLPPPEALPWMPYVAPLVAMAWFTTGLVVVLRWRKRPVGARGLFVPMAAGLLGAAGLAAALSAAQLFPVLEFTAQSGRAAGEGPHDIFPFSMEPHRCVEFLWPNFFGMPYQGNRSWHAALPATKPTKIWVPTLYVGALTLVLALGAAGFRRATPWKAWMTGVALLGLLLSFGEFTGPLFYARFAPTLALQVGPHDTDKDGAIRTDRHLRDGDGSLYWLVATGLPGFRQFRFPSKLLAFTVLGLASLGGLGLDDLLRGQNRRRTAMIAGTLLAVTVAALTAAEIGRPALTAWVRANTPGSSFGPADPVGAVGALRFGLWQAAVVLGIGLALALRGHRHARLAGGLALIVTTADLAVANARYVLTVPQSVLEGTPEVLKHIEQAEARRPADGPYRVHRMALWNPLVWNQEASRDRVRDFTTWERNTLQPKYGITRGVHYTATIGVAELYDYEWFFGAFPRRTDETTARQLGLNPGEPIVVFPRRAFDLWTTRYFVLPYHPNRWNDEHRGFASFLENTETVYPPPEMFRGPGGESRAVEWTVRSDYQVRRNLAAYPRSWVVHGARYLKPVQGLNRADRDLPMQEILFSNDLMWKDATRTVYDPKEVAWVSQEDQVALTPFLRGTSPAPGEGVKVVSYEPQRVELEATLETPGLVVLADVYYPGWELTIGGQAAPVYRANRMMRGAAVTAGRHRLVYTFRPRSLRVGLAVSVLGALGLIGYGFVSLRRPVAPAWVGLEEESP